MNELPFLSVIIPTRNRPVQLAQCLRSLAAQNYPRDRWEVIVVEDGGQEPADLELGEFADILPLRSLRQPHSGVGIARNNGAAHAHGHYLLFTDDDCLFPEDWLSRYAERFALSGECLIAGRSINVLVDNIYSQATQELIDYLLFHFNVSPENATIAIGNNLGTPAEAFRAMGGFDPQYYRMAAEDRDLGGRWLAQGGRMVYAPEIIVHHAHRLTLRSFLRQHFHYGRGAWLLHKLEAQRWKSGHQLQPAAFYLSLLLWPWKHRTQFNAVRMAILLGAAQAATAAGYLREWLS
jgi:GT2 family glycosyltransferase